MDDFSRLQMPHCWRAVAFLLMLCYGMVALLGIGMLLQNGPSVLGLLIVLGALGCGYAAACYVDAFTTEIQRRNQEDE